MYTFPFYDNVQQAHLAWAFGHGSVIRNDKASKRMCAVHCLLRHITAKAKGCRTAQHSTAQHSTAQHSTAQHSTAQHSTANGLPPTQLLYCSQWRGQHVRAGHWEVSPSPTRAQDLVSSCGVEPHGAILHLQQGPSLSSSFCSPYTSCCPAACCTHTPCHELQQIQQHMCTLYYAEPRARKVAECACTQT